MKYVMIDFENVQPNLAAMATSKDDTVIMVFLGQNQTKVRDKTRQYLGGNGEVIQIEGQGRNALDFHIAFYIGLLAGKHAGAQFFIVSRDTGFDPLIRYLRAQEISCQRILPAEKVHCATSTQEPNAAQMKAVIDNLKKHGKSVPKKLRTLRNVIKDVLRNDLSGKSLDAAIHELKKRGVVKETNGKLSYQL
jgi:PIN domain